MLRIIKLEQDEITVKQIGFNIMICPDENTQIIFSSDAALKFYEEIQKLLPVECVDESSLIDRKIKEVMEIDSQNFLTKSPKFAVALLNAQTQLLLAHMELMVSEKEQDAERFSVRV